MSTLLQINTVVNSGSTGRIAEEIGQKALAKGWKSYIAYGRGNGSSQSELIKIGDGVDQQLHGLRTRLLDGHGFGSKNASLQFIEKIKELKPDIIHLHNIHGYYLNIKVLFKYLAETSIPVIWTLHDCWPMTGHCTYFDFVGCQKWQTGCFDCPQKREYPGSYFLDRSKENYKTKMELFTAPSNLTIVAISSWLANVVRQSFLGSSSVQVINNGINTEVIRPAPGVIIRDKFNVQDRFLILGVANDWIPRKGLNDFIQLGKRLDQRYQIVLVGVSDAQIRALPSNIIGIRKTSDLKELIEIYSAADVFINPTWEDNFPTTNLEAQACGTPVITYNSGGSPETIDSQTGIVVEPGDIESLIEAIEEIQKRGKESYSSQCIDNVRRNYNKDIRFQDYLNLYHSIINKKASPQNSY